MNDFEIVSRAGIGIAMGNSVEELKAAADYVTDPIDRDGVWNVLPAFWMDMRRNEMAKQFDVIVIGAGPGGYTAALKERSLDLRWL